jgi:hypothetical protein
MSKRTTIPNTQARARRNADALPNDKAEEMREWVANDKQRTDAEAASRAEMTNLMRPRRQT